MVDDSDSDANGFRRQNHRSFALFSYIVRNSGKALYKQLTNISAEAYKEVATEPSFYQACPKIIMKSYSFEMLKFSPFFPSPSTFHRKFFNFPWCSTEGQWYSRREGRVRGPSPAPRKLSHFFSLYNNDNTVNSVTIGAVKLLSIPIFFSFLSCSLVVQFTSVYYLNIIRTRPAQNQKSSKLTRASGYAAMKHVVDFLYWMYSSGKFRGSGVPLSVAKNSSNLLI